MEDTNDKLVVIIMSISCVEGAMEWIYRMYVRDS